MSRILDKINDPKDLKVLNDKELVQLASEIRDELIGTVSKTGGHLAPNLGVVELSLALHSVFDSPRDKIIWDVGHQSYVHKMLTGRRQALRSLRMHGGLSGFPKRRESIHDPYDTGHSSTSISIGLGMAIARDLSGERYNVISIVGDGSLTGGMAFEAMNQAGHLESDFIVVLNDNEMSISRNVGALSSYLSKIRMDPRLMRFKGDVETLVRRIPAVGDRMADIAKRVKDSVKYLVVPGMLFEQLGFTYLGPIDGHDIPAIKRSLANAARRGGPVLVHIITKKGRGYKPAEDEPSRFHGTAPFDIKTGKPLNNASGFSFTEFFSDALCREAERDERIIAITAAMPEGTGLNEFSRRFGGRFFDVGIAEQHAVTLAGGLATSGYKPVVAVYSTFLQRAYDQILHDVALQGLPVIFAIDRAGIVGEDGETHQGSFDISYLRHIPSMIVMAPKDGTELSNMIASAFRYEAPVSLRYPRGRIPKKEISKQGEDIILGKGELLRDGDDIAIFAFGSMVYPSLDAAENLATQGIEAAVINSRFAKPLDEELIVEMARRTRMIVTVEEGSLAGGFGSGILELIESKGIYNVISLRLGIPDRFIEHGRRDEVLKLLGLDAEGIARSIKEHYDSEVRRKGVLVKEGKIRLDQYLTARGIFESREIARRHIKSGRISVDGKQILKPGTFVAESSEVVFEVEPLPYVSRGGLKLEKAIDTFDIDLRGMTAMDIGASTGGFTDCLLQHGTAKVYAIDVGSGQLAESLRIDPRVVLIEGTNIRYLSPEMIREPVDFFTVDVSFISITKFLDRLRDFIKDESAGVILIKPQFEAGRERVGKKGIVKDADVHIDVIREVLDYIISLGYTVKGLTYSPIRGGQGNIEYLTYIQNNRYYNYAEGFFEGFVESTVREAHNALGGR